MEADIDRKLKEPAFRKAWEDLDEEFTLLESMIKARERAGISQAELARRIGTKQSAISRLERSGFKTASVDTLNKIAHALDARLVIRLETKRSAPGSITKRKQKSFKESAASAASGLRVRA